MNNRTYLPQHIGINLLGRLLFTGLFLLSGVTHFTHIPYYISLMPENTPYPTLFILVSGVVELVGACMVLFNRHAKLGAWLLVAFLLPVTLVVHGYEMINATSEVMRAMQQAHVVKGFALIGAGLLISQLGVSQPLAADYK